MMMMMIYSLRFVFLFFLIMGLTRAWMPARSSGWRSTPLKLKHVPITTTSTIASATRYDDLVSDAPGAAVDDRYYSVPPTQPQVLVNSKPRITLTRFLSNIVKENPEVRTKYNTIQTTWIGSFLHFINHVCCLYV